MTSGPGIRSLKSAQSSGRLFFVLHRAASWMMRASFAMGHEASRAAVSLSAVAALFMNN